MNNYKDKRGRYTKEPRLQTLHQAIDIIAWWTKKLFIGLLIFGSAYISILTLYHEINREWYITPVIAQKALTEPNIAPQDTLGGVLREVTMYTSRPEETDATPCIGASGQDQCVLWRNGQNICATNAFPIGTELHIDKLGDCLVMDTMNSRFSERIDWYAGYDDDCLDGYDKYDVCPTLKRAKNFGLQNLLVTVK